MSRKNFSTFSIEGKKKQRPRKSALSHKAAPFVPGAALHSTRAEARRAHPLIGVLRPKVPSDGKSKKVSARLPDRVEVKLDDDTVLAMGGLMNLNTVYEFCLKGRISIAVDSFGNIDQFVATDPSASGWNAPEWSTLTALFSEFKLREFKIQFVQRYPLNNNGTISDSFYPPLLIGGNLGTAVAPGGYQAVADNADSKFWSFLADNSPTGYTHTIKAGGIQWSQVTTPTVEPYAGAPGCIQFYSSGLPANNTLLELLITGIYEFRSRV